jgi:acetyl-CoA acetyltransferase
LPKPHREPSTKAPAPTPRLEGLAKLKPAFAVFAARGSVTAGNSSQTSPTARVR